MAFVGLPDSRPLRLMDDSNPDLSPTQDSPSTVDVFSPGVPITIRYSHSEGNVSPAVNGDTTILLGDAIMNEARLQNTKPIPDGGTVEGAGYAELLPTKPKHDISLSNKVNMRSNMMTWFFDGYEGPWNSEESQIEHWHRPDHENHDEVRSDLESFQQHRKITAQRAIAEFDAAFSKG
jgi:hypothetical protein